ncbi:MAG: hypothetical protein KAI97_02825 [Gemmatimonadetes bacterium]|nr:hypothetical protein [Gemmatimonadota bacterium]
MIRSFSLAGACLLAAVAAGQAQVPDHSTGQPYLSVTPYLWLANANIDARIGPRALERDLSTSDIFGDLEIGLMAYVEAGKNGWGVFIEPRYVKLSDVTTIDVPVVGPAPLDWEATLVWFDFGGLRQVHDYVWLYAGARYFSLDTELGIVEVVEDRSEHSWWNGFVGGRVVAPLSPSVQVVGRADYGFGDSDANAQVRGALMYFFSPNWAVDVGFLYVLDEYTTSGDLVDLVEYGLDTDWYGAFVGLTYSR